MRKQILVLVIIIGFLFTGGLPCSGEDFSKHQFFKNGFGSMSSLENFKIPNPAILKKKLVKKPSPDEPFVDIYVNGATGKDKPKRGYSPERALKTIGYAISRVPFMRPSSDFYANIHIAEGAYNEYMTINIDRVGLYGAGSDNTQIVGSEEFDTIDVINSDNIIIEAIKIVNGYNGIDFEGSSGMITDTTIAESFNNGIFVRASSNIVIKDCLVKDTTGNFGIGLHVSESSHAYLTGNVSFVSNYLYGIAVSNNGSVDSNMANVTASGSTGAGLFLSQFSGIWLFASTFSAVDNNTGIVLGQESILTATGGKLTAKDNNFIGLFVDGGTINFDWGEGNSIIDNGQDLILQFGARASFYGEDEIGDISCDGTVLIRGNQSCP